MRLLNSHSLEFKEFQGDDIPRYAILSHTWAEDEVTFQDFQNGGSRRAIRQKKGYVKIEACCNLAADDELEWAWIDTCCIDKTSSAELTEAINSMFQWYEQAHICYAFLADVPGSIIAEDPSSKNFIRAFQASRWFTRGWTLQELLAPRDVIFFSSDWNEIGTKLTLSDAVSAVTGIDGRYILGESLSKASIAKRMSWASARVTTRIEDIAYCLLGIFAVNMPLLYGEGTKAFLRLQEEILKNSGDQSIFAWWTSSAYARGRPPGALILSPAGFRGSGKIVPIEMPEPLRSSHSITNRGLKMTLPLIEDRDGSMTEPYFYGRLAVLACRDEDDFTNVLALQVAQENGPHYTRWNAERLWRVPIHRLYQGAMSTIYIQKALVLEDEPTTMAGAVDPKAILLRTFGIASTSYKLQRVYPPGTWDATSSMVRISNDDWLSLVGFLFQSQGSPRRPQLIVVIEAWRAYRRFKVFAGGVKSLEDVITEVSDNPTLMGDDGLVQHCVTGVEITMETVNESRMYVANIMFHGPE